MAVIADAMGIPDPPRTTAFRRQLEVAEMLTRGATDTDVAHTLFLSPRTVEKHVARVLAKLGTTRKDVQTALQAGQA